MVVVMHKIGEKKRKQTILTGNHENLQNYQFYSKLARKVAYLYGPHSSTYDIGKDEDAIAFIFEYLVFGSLSWDGRGNHFGFIVDCGKWAIRKWCYKRKIAIAVEEKMDWYDYKKNKDQNNEKIDISYIHYILDKTQILSKCQHKCLKKLVCEHKTRSEIADEYGISRQIVSIHIRRAITKIQKKYAEEQLSRRTKITA